MPMNKGRYDSRTEAHEWTTAARIGKEYVHGAPVSTNANKSSDRPDDGEVTSHAYAEASKDAGRDSREGGCEKGLSHEPPVENSAMPA